MVTRRDLILCAVEGFCSVQSFPPNLLGNILEMFCFWQCVCSGCYLSAGPKEVCVVGGLFSNQRVLFASKITGMLNLKLEVSAYLTNSGELLQ